MNIVGRESERQLLDDILRSERPEFLVVYGRRRVGKTYLIREFFKDRFSFYATGVPNTKTKEQLKVFHTHLMEYGSEEKRVPQDWLEAFGRLKELLETDTVARNPVGKRRVIFLDELPWMDTARSDFRMALDHFWNSYASAKSDIVLIVCGSATSWIIDNILLDTGGLYNRVTRRMMLSPFSLSECEEMLKHSLPGITKSEVIDYYMAFGGIPFYLNMFDARWSVAQNIDKLLFDENAPLKDEYSILFRTLFKHSERYTALIDALSKKNIGMTRQELINSTNVVGGSSLTKMLRELEQCRFIRKYKDYTQEKNGCVYQIIDPFILLNIKVANKKRISSWEDFMGTPAYYAWRGNAFEILVLNHIDRIKTALGISGVSTMEYAWRSKKADKCVQIDLIIDRKDNVINVCEMKYSDEEFVIDKRYEKELLHKCEVFRRESGTKKAVRLTLISANGLAHNENHHIVQNEIDGQALFM
ncbi:MAG: AAA family ATPase [Eubacterium sp.]|nr:AAA family ATPase [Eubacterium sp.]